RLVLAQIDQPPEEILGSSFELVEVQPNDSLSAIAGRRLGNELLFYSLARLNDITVPRLVRPGQRILVPRREADDEDEASETTAKPAVAAAAVASSAPEKTAPDATVKRLINSDRHRQAHALLLSRARSGQLDPAGRQALADVAIILAEQACRRDAPDAAV